MMGSNYTELAYRRTAVVGADGIGLVIALYDTLAGDMARAIAAIRKSDIEGRSNAIAHALQVLGWLEQWVAEEQDR